MNSTTQDIAHRYDAMYRRQNFFRYRPWMYRSYIRALAKRPVWQKGAVYLMWAVDKDSSRACLPIRTMAAGGIIHSRPSRITYLAGLKREFTSLCD
ncbi:MAG TPA: hypothetical protein VGY91_04050 [Chthoniobacterales bacterium]|nr:hypothetical protein [Chthoniobacterales bacterium]